MSAIRRLLPAAAAIACALPPAAAACRNGSPVAQPAQQLYPKVAVTRDVALPMPDGIRLYADLWRPALADGSPAPGRFPVVLVQTPYGKDRPVGILTSGVRPLFIAHGYIVVIVDVRGTGESEGVWSFFGEPEQRDYYDTARWVVTQPFSNGRLATYGGSYLGIDQLLMAARRPPGLKAVFAMVPSEDLYRDWLGVGGAIDTQFPQWLAQQTASNVAPPPAAVARDPGRAAAVLAARATDGQAARVIGGASADGELAYDGSFYRLRSPGTVAARIRVPTFIVGGWYDLFQRGEPRLYNELRLPPGRKQLLMGPWYHATTGNGLGHPGWPPDLDKLALAWFDRWLKGVRNGIERFGPVTVNQLGTGRWQTYPSFPPPGAAYQRWYLGPRRTLSRRPPTGPVADSIPANQLNGACSRSTFQWIFAAADPTGSCDGDNRGQEASALTYTSPPLDQPLHLAGPLALQLRGSTTAADTTWVATVSDVAPSGRSTQLTAGWLVDSMRAADRTRSTLMRRGDLIVPFHPFTKASRLPVVRGAVDDLQIEIFNTDAVLERGHRLRLTISSGDVPHLLVPLGNQVRSAGAIVTVHSSSAEPSVLIVQAAPS